MSVPNDIVAGGRTLSVIEHYQVLEMNDHQLTSIYRTRNPEHLRKRIARSIDFWEKYRGFTRILVSICSVCHKELGRKVISNKLPYGSMSHGYCEQCARDAIESIQLTEGEA